jgi:hypothetical protein
LVSVAGTFLVERLPRRASFPGITIMRTTHASYFE